MSGNELGDVVDKMQRKIAAESARETLHRFVAVLYVLLPRGTIVFATEKADTMFGYLPGELATKNVSDLMPERLRARHVSHLIEFSDNPTQRPMGRGIQLIALHRSGKEFPIQIELDAFVAEGFRFGVANIARASGNASQ